VATQNRVAGEAGARVLAAGGNAVDAAVATGFALAAVEPWNSGLGGVGFMLIYSAKTKRVSVVDFGPISPRGLDVAAVSGRSVLALAYTIILGSVVTLTAYIYLLRVVSPARVGTYAFVNPLIAVVVGWAFAGESVGPRTVMAGALILAGVAAISLTTDD